ncbi:hypothetical protein [Embleya sp. NPDC059259]|uniref:hypothetical protein n=1 Tax=unclassified Embleya TaxID=2699296 RepID=UPI0036A155C9
MNARVIAAGFGLAGMLLLVGCGSTEGRPGRAVGSGGLYSPGASPPATGRSEAPLPTGPTPPPGVEPRFRYVTTVPGYELAAQSVAVYGDTGFQSVYVSAQGRRIHLAADTGGPSTAACPSTPPASGTCAADGDTWYRSTSAEHTYARAGDGLVVWVWADPKEVDRATLRAAMSAAQPATAPGAGTTTPRPEPTTASTPIERGDLPPVGDGAPMNHPPVGG